MKKKYFLPLLFMFCYSVSLFSFPFRFQRLIYKNNNAELKVVDLIYEAHFLKTERVKRPSRRRKEFVLERKKFSSSERAFLATLRQQADQKQDKIRLLWEWVDEQREDKIGLEKGFIAYAGSQLSQELAPGKNKSIVFTAADTYRFNRYLFLSLYYPNDDPVLQKPVYKGLLDEKLEKAIAFISTLSQKDLPSDLEIARPKVDQKTFKYLHTKWLSTKETLKGFYSKYLETTLKETPDITIRAFKNQLGSEDHPFYDDFADSAFLPIPNLEMLFKIFSSQENHVILYAGGGHCKDIAQYLSELGFKTVIDIGLTSYGNVIVTLSPNAWDFLKDDLAAIRKRAQRRPIKRLKTEDFPHDVVMASNIKTLEALIKEALNSYISVVNAQIGASGSTLLHLMISGDFLHFDQFSQRTEGVQLLLKYGANPNIQDSKGDTPLFDAIRIRHEEIVRLLLTHGALKTIKNNDGKSSLDIAKEVGNKAIEKMLTQKKETSSPN